MSSSPLGPEEVDAAFADIVARLEETPSAPAADAEEPAAEARPEPSPPTPVPWRVDPTGSVEKALLSEDEELFGEEEGFVPADPAALPPASDRTFWVALVGLGLGPVLLLVALLGRDSLSSWWAWGGLALLVTGFVALVARLPREREDPGDNGARV